MRESVAVKRSAEHAGKSSADDVVRNFIESIDSGKRSDQPYRHWPLKDCLPTDTVDDILALPFEAPSLEGVSGKRELHNNTRKYFDVENRKRFPGLRGGGAGLPGQAHDRATSRRCSAPTSPAPISASSSLKTSTASGSSRTPISA